MSDYLIERYTRMLASEGLKLEKASRILDFCCGKGACVTTFRNAGFAIDGFEPFGNYWPDPYKELESMPDLAIDWRGFRTPYSDASFDFVYSQEVMEHISDHDSVFCELARITKPDGAGIHTFPAICRPMECHIRVPFGNLFKCYAYYRLWLALFPFNPWPKKCSRRDLARLAHWYAKGSLHYLTPRRAVAIASKHFRNVRLAPEFWGKGRFASWTQHVVLIVSHPIITRRRVQVGSRTASTA